MKKYPNRALRNLLLQLRLVSNRDLFLLLLGKVEMMASTDPGAAKFLKTYGPHGWLATPSEWQRSYLHGLPTTSIVVERVHRECKRVWFSYRKSHSFILPSCCSLLRTGPPTRPSRLLSTKCASSSRNALCDATALKKI